ncbi:MAG: LptF/LptG family permease [Saprospiraceae bacterium]|nr:LptF/LptG family permease [Saprospiraceae bacterium]
MKKIDKLVTTGFVGPAILSFFVAEFVLIMQFLWKYIDEILGKGFTIAEMLELIFYYGVTLIPLAVPITILISSVMVFGDMSEKYELSSMKSAGISLFRVMLPGLFIAVFVGLFSIFASNYLKPASNLQFQKRFISLRKQKSALSIEQGIFNDAFDNYIIRVKNIGKNGRDIEDVLIYDHSPNDKSLINFLSAKSGEMYTAEEGKYFIMKLDTGIQYREMEKKSSIEGGRSELPFMRTYFDEWVKTFDMSQFDLDDGILNFNSKKEDMMNGVQILREVDTFRTNINIQKEKVMERLDLLFPSVEVYNISSKTKESIVEKKEEDSTQNLLKESHSKGELSIVHSQNTKLSPQNQQDSTTTSSSSFSKKPKSKMPVKVLKSAKVSALATAINNSSVPITPEIQNKKLVNQKYTVIDSAKSFISTIDSVDFNLIVTQALSELSRDRDELATMKNFNLDNSAKEQKYLLRFHQHYSWAFVCIVFLFIGAPMGSIIRKGGYGYPFLVAILFYMLFIITTIMGEKLIKTDSITGIMAAWMPCLVLLPFSIVLSVLALKDIRINFGFLIDWYYRLRRVKNNVAMDSTPMEAE